MNKTIIQQNQIKSKQDPVLKAFQIFIKNNFKYGYKPGKWVGDFISKNKFLKNDVYKNLDAYINCVEILSKK